MKPIIAASEQSAPQFPLPGDQHGGTGQHEHRHLQCLQRAPQPLIETAFADHKSYTSATVVAANSRAIQRTTSNTRCCRKWADDIAKVFHLVMDHDVLVARVIPLEPGGAAADPPVGSGRKLAAGRIDPDRRARRLASPGVPSNDGRLAQLHDRRRMFLGQQGLVTNQVGQPLVVQPGRVDGVAHLQVEVDHVYHHF